MECGGTSLPIIYFSLYCFVFIFDFISFTCSPAPGNGYVVKCPGVLELLLL